MISVIIPLQKHTKINNMRKISLLVMLIVAGLLLGNKASAQDQNQTPTPAPYQVAAGLKFGGYEDGISGKYFFNNNNAIEGVLGFRSHGVVVTGLYEIHQTAFNVKELNFYYGAGAHLGGVGAGNYRRYSGDDYQYHDSSVLFGLDGVIGLEYVIPQSPIAVSLDLNPRVELATGPFFDLSPGLGIKYVFR